MHEPRLILDYAREHASRHPERVFLTQPVGGGTVADLSWGQTLEQALRMAAHLQLRGFPPGARIGILSKNCAHFIVAELAIWLAGYTTVAIFPTETAGTVKFVLEHSEASLLFVGKLDDWAQQRPGVPQGLPCIALPLGPPGDLERWDDVVARTPPLAEPARRTADELAMLLYTSGSTGQPKGVMTSFGAFTRSAEGIREKVRSHLGHEIEGRLLSYLPLAHALERRRPPAVIPAARARTGACLGRRFRPRRRQHAGLFRGVARDLRGRPAACAADAVHVGAATVDQVPAGRVRARATRAARPAAARAAARPHRRAQGARRAGPRPGDAGGQRLRPHPGRGHRVVSAPRPAPLRRLCDDRGHRLLTHLVGRPARAGLRRRAAAGC